MIFKIIIVSIVLLVLAGLALAAKYYNKKNVPLCHSPDSYNGQSCSICGVDNVEDCKEEESKNIHSK